MHTKNVRGGKSYLKKTAPVCFSDLLQLIPIGTGCIELAEAASLMDRGPGSLGVQRPPIVPCFGAGQMRLDVSFGTPQLSPNLERGSGWRHMQAAGGRVAGDKPAATCRKAGAGPEPGG